MVTPKNSRQNLHDNFLAKFGQNDLHPQKFACSYTYVFYSSHLFLADFKSAGFH